MTKVYSQRRLAWRRKVLTALQGEAARRRPKWWSNIDQQEAHPGDLSLASAEKANGPLAGWHVFHGEEHRYPPLWLCCKHVVYWLRCRLTPHPEWMWTLRETDRGQVIVKRALRTLNALVGWIDDTPWSTSLIAEGIVGTLTRATNAALWFATDGHWGEEVKWWRRYPQRLIIQIDERDLARLEDRWQEMVTQLEKDGGSEEQVPENVKRNVRQSRMIEAAVERRLGLNIPWLECSYSYRVNGNEVRIRVRRSGRELARYRQSWESVWDWEDRSQWAMRRIKLEAVA